MKRTNFARKRKPTVKCLAGGEKNKAFATFFAHWRSEKIIVFGAGLFNFTLPNRIPLHKEAGHA